MTNATAQLQIPHIDPARVREVLGRSILTDGMPFVVDLDKSHDARIVDAQSGKSYIDFFTYFATAPIGHNHPAMTDPAFLDHIGRVAISNPSNADFYTEQMAAFVDTLATTATPPSLPHLFFVAGGGLAVENGLKAAFDWKFQKRAARGLPDDENLMAIHFRESFHGRTGYTMSLTNTDPNKVKWFPKFDWPRVTNPKITFPLKDHLADVEAAEKQSLEEIRSAIAKDGDRVAAIIIEPIQGEGGDNHFRPEFFNALRAIADENELLLIVDEVQTGVGTTGKWWAYQNYGFEPDVLCFGKKMQVCGIMASRRLDEVDSVFKVSSRINSTWGANLVDMVRATRFLQVIEAENLLDNAAAQGERLLDGLRTIESDAGAEISNVRGLGLFVAFTLADGEKRNAALERMLEKGLLALSSGSSSIRFRPPLTVTSEEVDEALRITADALTSG